LTLAWFALASIGLVIFQSSPDLVSSTSIAAPASPEAGLLIAILSIFFRSSSESSSFGRAAACPLSV